MNRECITRPINSRTTAERLAGKTGMDIVPSVVADVPVGSPCPKALAWCCDTQTRRVRALADLRPCPHRAVVQGQQIDGF